MSDVDNQSVANNNPTPVAPGSGQAELPASTPGPAETAAGEQTQGTDGQQPSPPRNRSAEKRISRLTAKAEAAIREASYWRGIAEASRTPGAEPPADGAQPPQQQTRATPQDAPHRADIEHNKSVLGRIEKEGEGIEDFDDVMEAITSPEFPISRTMRDFLGESDKPAHMAKWLADNPAEAARIARLEPAVAVRALEKAEARLASKPAPKPTSNTPPPPPTVSGRGSPQFNPETASMEEYKQHWDARRAKAGIR